MPRVSGITMLAGCVLLGAPAGGELSAQSSTPATETATGALTPVCPLLSVAEVRKITGLDDYAEPWEVGPGEGIGGGSACVYEGAASSLDEPPMIGFTLIQGKNWTQGRRKVKLLPGCKQEPVKGVGDDAFFESCPNSPRRRSDPLYVKVGSNDLIVEMGVKEPATKASVRPTVIAFAKAVAAKVR
jgi:hypothetical protein